jgi:DHA2 family multidrug resistance protein
MTALAAAHPEHATGRQWLIAPLVAFAAFMQILDVSIANVSLVHIAGALSASREESTWVLTAFIVANAIVLPVSGWLASVLGRKVYFLFCIGGFVVTSLLCGLAPSLTWLIVFRAIQGFTSGGLGPTSQSILADSFPPHQRAMAFAIYGMAAMFAPAIGPTLGGWITDEFSWRWIFLINVPIGAVLFWLVAAMVEDPEHVRARRDARRGKPIKIDYIGFTLLALGFGTLQLMLDQGEQRDWFSSPVILAAGLTCIVALTAFVLWVIGREDPIVDLSLLKDRNFAIANALMLMIGFSMFTTTVLLPVMVQQLFGYTALLAGLLLSPGSFLIIVMMPVVAQLQKYVNARILIGIGLLFSALGLFVMTGINLQTDFWTLCWIRVLQLVGNAFLFGPVTTMAYQDMPNARSDGASAFLNLARNLGGSIGIATLLTFLAQRTQFHHARLVEHVSPSDPQYLSLVEAIQAKMVSGAMAGGDALMQAQAVIARMVDRQATMMGFLDCFLALGAAFAAMSLFALFMRGGKPMRHPRRGGGPAPERPAMDAEIV